MTRHASLDRVPYGLYLSARPLDARFVGADGERLEGLPGVAYRRVPNPVAVALAPVLGALFVTAFPAVILAAVFTGISRLLAERARAAATSTARVATARYAPSAAWLDGQGLAEAEGTAIDPELADLEAEVARRRA